MWGRIVPLLCLACLGPQLSDACTPGSRACENPAFSSGDAWLCSLIGSLLVGLSGVLPLLVIPVEAGAVLRSKEGSQRLKQLLSFAIGGLLGDVFVHLLPEAWAYTCSANTGSAQSLQQQRLLGLWVIIGFLAFLMLEKAFLCDQQPDTDSTPNASLLNGKHDPSTKQGALGQNPAGSSIKASGYLNLLANTIDNFTHGMAVAGSFLVSKKVGILTTLAILLHEIPHEVGDFAILLRAGFDRWSAAKMQLTTALGGIFGAGFAICAQSPKGAVMACSACPHRRNSGLDSTIYIWGVPVHRIGQRAAGPPRGERCLELADPGVPDSLWDRCDDHLVIDGGMTGVLHHPRTRSPSNT